MVGPLLSQTITVIMVRERQAENSFKPYKQPAQCTFFTSASHRSSMRSKMLYSRQCETRYSPDLSRCWVIWAKIAYKLRLFPVSRLLLYNILPRGTFLHQISKFRSPKSKHHLLHTILLTPLQKSLARHYAQKMLDFLIRSTSKSRGMVDRWPMRANTSTNVTSTHSWIASRMWPRNVTSNHSFLSVQEAQH